MVLFFVAQIQYDAANAIEWCVDHEDVDGRNGCTSDETCLANGRNICDADSNCFGIAWYNANLNVGLKICRSKVMATKTDGWRTMLKQGIIAIF